MTRRTLLVAGALLALSALVAGCATVPDSSPVQVLRTVNDGGAAVLPPGPVDGSTPLDVVRGFVVASGSSADGHAAARRFLAPEAAVWDDNANLTVVSDQFDTVPQEGSDADEATVRVRAARIGQIGPNGAFEPAGGTALFDVSLMRRDGQWRISQVPPGAVVTLSDFRENYRDVRTYFADPARRSVVTDLRYVPASPGGAQPARVVELLLAGPSRAIDGAAVSILPPTARLRSNVAETPDGAVVVDLTDVGEIDDAARRVLAAQVVLSLSEVNVPRVRLLVDGAPLLPDRPDVVRNDVIELAAEADPSADVRGVVTVGGRVHELAANQATGGISGPAGNGAIDALSASVSPDGQWMAVLAREGGRQRLLVGPRLGPFMAIGPPIGSATRPSWMPRSREVWTVADRRSVVRATVADGAVAAGPPVDVGELAAGGPVTDLRLSRDGLRVAAVVDGLLVTGAVGSGPEATAVRNVRTLRPDDLTAVTAVDWRSAETLVAAGPRSVGMVATVSVDGLDLQRLPTTNLTPPLVAVAAAPSRLILVTDQSGLWSFGGSGVEAWRVVPGGAPGAVPAYPG